jgi:predicted transcriptional regulator
MTVIAMTREIGSHGSEIAAQVAAKLGLEVINSEIVTPQVAGAMGIEESAVQRYLDGKATLFDRWQIDTRKLSQYTLDQILNLALKNNVLNGEPPRYFKVFAASFACGCARQLPHASP